MSTYKEDRLLRIIELLMEQTRNGTLEWEERYGNTYQTTLGSQTLVLEREQIYNDIRLGTLLSSALIPRKTASLEIRGKKGEVLERVEASDRRNDIGIQRALAFAIDTVEVGYSKTVTDAVDVLYDLVQNRKEAVAEAALDNLLEALEEN